MALERLLTVTDVFEISGRGIIVLPPVPARDFTGPVRRDVHLRNPNGDERIVSASFDIPRTANMDPQNLQFVCMIAGLVKADVPIGTEVWSFREERGNAG